MQKLRGLELLLVDVLKPSHEPYFFQVSEMIIFTIYLL